MASQNNKKRRRLENDEDYKVVDRTCCGVSYLRNFLYIFNIILFLSGVALLGIGIWILLDQFSYVSFFLSDWYKGLTFLTITCGGLVVLVTIVGCCGARLPNSGCLGLFATLLMLILLGELSLGILAYFYEFMIGSEMTKTLNTTITKEYNFVAESTQAIDELQREMKCCGAASYKDWRWSAWMSNYTVMKSNPITKVVKFKTPDSCCISEVEGCGERHHPSNIYVGGCEESLNESVKGHLRIMGALGLGLSCLQIFGIIFSCCLIKRLQKWKDRQKEALWKS